MSTSNLCKNKGMATSGRFNGNLHYYYNGVQSWKLSKTRGVDTVQSTTLKVSECDALDSAAYSFGVLTWETTVHLRDARPCVFAKAESINNMEDMAHPSCGVLMHYEEAEAKSGMHDDSACAQPRPATTA
ncbi:hypothetical protein MRX96_013592 [Rhipicephalus microplus]